MSLKIRDEGSTGAWTDIPTPQYFYIDDRKIQTADRVISGGMVVDYTASKKSFRLEYTDMTGANLNTLIGLLTDETFFDLQYPTESTTASATVTAGDIPRRLWDNSGDKRYDSIRIELIEK